LQRLLKRMFTKREETESGDALALDPARKEFTAFIGDICLGKLVNPKVPRQTGRDFLFITSSTIKKQFYLQIPLLHQVPHSTTTITELKKLPTKSERYFLVLRMSLSSSV
jgi:hypothetical protein